jgi:FkbM family methyltransferase
VRQTAKISTLQQVARLESASGSIRFVGKLVRRAATSIGFRTRTAIGRLDPRLLVRNVIFPIRNVLLRNKPLTVIAGGQSFRLVPEGAVPMEMWSKRYFEEHELEFILDVLQPGMNLLDIGANVGLFAIPAATKVQHGKVFAFEPSSWALERLKRNTDLNRVSNVQVVHSAVGDFTGDAILQVNAIGKDGLNTIGRPAHEDSEIVSTEKVPVTTVDDFVKAFCIPHVDVMKVDVEGAELLVFCGAVGLLAQKNAPLILYESGFLSKGFGYHPVESMWLLQKHGYTMFVIDSRNGKISVPANSRAYNAMVIAVKPSHPAFSAVQERAR